MQCVIVKHGVRCTEDSNTGQHGIILPIVKPEAQVWICYGCIDDMHFVVHQVESKLIPPELRR